MKNHQSRLFLIGPRCSGKTTMATTLGKRLHIPYRDTDDMVVDDAGMSIAHIVAREGWVEFRRRESVSLVNASHQALIIATGGGMILDEKNRELMRAAGQVFFLSAPVDCLYERMERQGLSEHRPSLTGESPLEELSRIVAERLPLYQATAHHCIDASQPVEAVAASIMAIWDHGRTA